MSLAPSAWTTQPKLVPASTSSPSAASGNGFIELPVCSALRPRPAQGEGG